MTDRAPSASPISRPPRVGAVVPPANPTVEPELHRLLGACPHLHVARLPVLDGDLRTRLGGYRRCLPEMLRAFGTLTVDALLIACTGSSYPLGPRGDRELCERLEQAAGRPVATAARAVSEALSRGSIEQLVLATPYPEWLTAECQAFWRDDGRQIRGVIDLSHGEAVYALDPAAIGERVLAGLAGVPPIGERGAILFTGTGMPTLAAAEVVREQTGAAVLSSNLCSAQWLSRTVA